MQSIISITSQGQLTIPKSIRRSFGFSSLSTKALIRKQGNRIIVEPKGSFWALEGALKSKVKLSDNQLREARNSFANQGAKR